MRLRESVTRENRTPRLGGGRWPALGRLGAPPPTRRIPLYEILEDRGFDVLLVNARDVHNVRGRKSDVTDCEWLRELHSVGLLRASFRPAAAIMPLQPSAYWGDQKLWDTRANNHNSMFGKDGRLWLSATVRGVDNPAFCKKGSALPSAKTFPLDRSARSS